MMKKSFVFFIIGFISVLINNKILGAARSNTKKLRIYIEEKEKQDLIMLFSDSYNCSMYIKKLNVLLDYAEIPQIEQKIRNELNTYFYNSALHNDEVIEFFKNNRDRFLKFIDGEFLQKLLYNDKLELFKLFLNRNNVNTITDSLFGQQTLLIGAILILSPEIVALILKNGANVNQIVSGGYSIETALGMLAIKEAEERWIFKDNKHSYQHLQDRLKKIEEISELFFYAGAEIELGGKIKKNYSTEQMFDIKEDVNLIDLANHPRCKTVFDTYRNCKKRIAENMMGVPEIAMFPPGLLPLCLSYIPGI